MKQASLFIIDNVSTTRELLSKIFLSNNMTFQSFNSAESFLHQIDIQKNGSIILANRLPGIDGISLQSILNEAQSPLSLIFHTESISALEAIKAMKQGAYDILLRPVSTESLLNSVQGSLIASVQKAKHIDINKRLKSLTKKENAILEQILNGLTNQQIANLLCISLRTVEVHRANIMKKFDAINAVILAMKLSKTQRFSQYESA